MNMFYNPGLYIRRVGHLNRLQRDTNSYFFGKFRRKTPQKKTSPINKAIRIMKDKDRVIGKVLDVWDKCAYFWSLWEHQKTLPVESSNYPDQTPRL